MNSIELLPSSPLKSKDDGRRLKIQSLLSIESTAQRPATEGRIKIAGIVEKGQKGKRKQNCPTLPVCGTAFFC